jgi:hypothetical protein
VVEDKLARRWSPQQISGWLVRAFPDDAEMRVSHETIYLSLFVQSRGLSTINGQGQLRDTISIRERPAEADDRAVPGHWEGDLVYGKHMTAIATLVERQSRFVMLIALPEGHRAELVADALEARITTLPAQLRRSLTWDQGKEMADHARFSIDTGITVYFCHPRSPWQRGTNENTNGLLRQYFPKRSDLRAHSQADLDAVAAELNDRPRQPSDGAHHQKNSTKQCDDPLRPQSICSVARTRRRPRPAAPRASRGGEVGEQLGGCHHRSRRHPDDVHAHAAFEQRGPRCRLSRLHGLREPVLDLP